MGFPVGYPEVVVPNIFLHILSLLAIIRSLIFTIFNLLHLSDLLDTDAAAAVPDYPSPAPSLSAVLIRDLLPLATFRDLALPHAAAPPPQGCAVCLTEFADEDEIRCMANCTHIFHRACVDRWIDHDQKTCPLCRTPFVPHDKVQHYNQTLWNASHFCHHHHTFSL